MKTILSLAIFIFTNVIIAFSQSSSDIISRVKVSEIKNKELQGVFKNYLKRSFLELPIIFDKSFFECDDNINWRECEKKRTATQPCSYVDSVSPFYVNLDRRSCERNDSESRLFLIRDTNGDYIMGIIQAISRKHDRIKDWLVTFDLSGKMIDFLPIGEWLGADAWTIEAQINNNFTVDVQRLDFPDNDYIMWYDDIAMDLIYLDNLKGQRIDTKYQITFEGKFKKLEEIRYQPQIYTPEMLSQGKVTIRQRKEKRM